MNRTKIVATLGPATCNAEALRALHDAGMTTARLNGSHGDLGWHSQAIRLIRETLPMLPILLDIPGRKIRTTQLAVEPHFGRGDVVVLTTELGHDGSRKVPVNYGRLHEDVQPGTTIFADDGTLCFTVLSVEGRDIRCRAESAGTLRSRKGINVPSTPLRTELVTERDREMVAFARAHDVDFIGISFVETAEHIRLIRALINGPAPRIVAKVENRGGLERLEEILGEAEVVMIDRGDLSVETSIDQIALLQKRILSAAHRLGKPVIVATEMLHSMIQAAVPTKAEISDITNAVLDGAAATMLSGETAIGQYPTETVSLMRRVMSAAERHLSSTAAPARADGLLAVDTPDIGAAVGLLCQALPLTKVVVLSKTGYAASIVASQRLRQPILAVSDDMATARSFNMLPGTRGTFVDIPFSVTSTEHILACIRRLWEQEEFDAQDMILVVAVGYRQKIKHLNMLQSHIVGDLIATFGWSRESP